MKIPYPSRIPVQQATMFCLVVMAAELVVGTSLTFAGLSFLFLMLSVFAFNQAGGLYYPSGSYVFFVSLLTFDVGLIAKIVLGEPAETNLLHAEKTMLVYVAGMASMYLAVVASSRLRRRKALLQDMLQEDNTRAVAIGCLVVSLSGFVLPRELQSAWGQSGYLFMFMAIMLPVHKRVKETGGWKSFNLISFAAWFTNTVAGSLAFSKQGMFVASVCWGVAAIAAGYRVTLKKALILLVLIYLSATYLTPVAQIGRNMVGEAPTFDKEMNVAVELLSHPVDTRDAWARESLQHQEENIFYYHWYDEPQGLVDRLNMFSMDDALIYYTDHGVKGNLASIGAEVVNVVPRFLYPNKPDVNIGNQDAHKIGVLADEDVTTGVSFGPFADGYHTGQWLGITLIVFLIWFFVFLIVDSVAGDIRKSIWGLLYVMLYSHGAPEGLLVFPIYTAGLVTLAIIGAAFLIAKVVPVIGSFMSMPQRRLLREVSVSRSAGQ